MNLDELLDESAPATCERTTELTSGLEDLVLATESVARPRGRRLRTAAVPLMVITILGLGTAGAAAGGVVPIPSIPWMTAREEHCEMRFEAQPSSPGNGELKSREYSPAEYEHGGRVASAFLAAYDYAKIDRAQAIRDYRAEWEAILAAHPRIERRPPMDGSEAEINAVQRHVARELRAHMEAQNTPMETATFLAGWRCER